jgi:hypothetical protein
LVRGGRGAGNRDGLGLGAWDAGEAVFG